MTNKFLICGGTIVTMDASRRVFTGDILLEHGRIAALGPQLAKPRDAQLIDATGMAVVPGLIQGHVHLGQTLFKGLAEDRQLLSWLAERIWPLEAAHSEESAYWSGMLGAADCLLSGTTTIQDIGLTRGMDGIFAAIRDAGLRAIAGTCLMDCGDGVPPQMLQTAQSALAQVRKDVKRWHQQGRIHVNICPRFILSCSPELWKGCAALAQELGLSIHTHLLETRAEEEVVNQKFGQEELDFLDHLGVLDCRLCIAHGVHFSAKQREQLAGRPLSVIHCPSSNLKLGSGIADLNFLQATPGISVGIGCDGAPCNNDLDVLEEIRLAALLQQYKQGPGNFSAQRAFELATISGAQALGLEAEIGSLEMGKTADIAILDLQSPAAFGPENVAIYDRIVYSISRDAVRYVLVGGDLLVEHGKLCQMNPQHIVSSATQQIKALLTRAQLDASIPN